VTDYYAQVHGHYGGPFPWSFGFHITSSQAESTLATTWNTAWQSAWTDSLHGLETLYPVATAMDSTSVATLSGVMRELTKTSVPAALPGTAAGDTLPYLNSTLISLRSNQLGPHRRGRVYLPAMEETNVNVDILIPAAVTRVSLALNAVKAAIEADGSTFFVTNKLALKDLTPPFQKTVITKFLVSNKPARQSRRARKILAVYT
jgi:hypothetical protein